MFLSADGGVAWHDHTLPAQPDSNFAFGPDGRPYFLIGDSLYRATTPDQW